MDNEIGKFVRWGEVVTVDIVKRIMTFLPESQPEELVEIPDEETPSDEALGARVSSF